MFSEDDVLLKGVGAAVHFGQVRFSRLLRQVSHLFLKEGPLLLSIRAGEFAGGCSRESCSSIPSETMRWVRGLLDSNPRGQVHLPRPTYGVLGLEVNQDHFVVRWDGRGSHVPVVEGVGELWPG